VAVMALIAAGCGSSMSTANDGSTIVVADAPRTTVPRPTTTEQDDHNCEPRRV
jgi:hypothetical protein